MSPRLVIEGQLIRPRFRIELVLDLDLSTALGVLGPTGAGKTTLLRLIAGLEPHFTGLIQFDGETWSEFDRPDLVPTHRRQLGDREQGVHAHRRRTAGALIERDASTQPVHPELGPLTHGQLAGLGQTEAVPATGV